MDSVVKIETSAQGLLLVGVVEPLHLRPPALPPRLPITTVTRVAPRKLGPCSRCLAEADTREVGDSAAHLAVSAEAEALHAGVAETAHAGEAAAVSLPGNDDKNSAPRLRRTGTFQIYGKRAT